MREGRGGDGKERGENRGTCREGAGKEGEVLVPIVTTIWKKWTHHLPDLQDVVF